MKRILIVLLALALIGGAALADEAGLLADMQAVKELAPAVEAQIQKYASILHGAQLDSVTVNPNYGTDESGDYIVLVYMTYDQYNSPAADVNTVVQVSCTVADAVTRSSPGAVELCVFWELPGYDSQGKIQFLIDGDDYQYGDAMLPKVLADAWGGMA